MRTLLKVVIISLALFAASFVVAFGYGIYLGITGQTTTSAADTTAENVPGDAGETSDQDAPQDTGTESASTSAAGAGTTPAPVQPNPTLPAEVFTDVRSAVGSLQRRGLLIATERGVEIDRDGFANLELADAIALHEALNDGDSEYTPVRMLMFAGCSLMPDARRRQFADAVGAVHPRKIVTTRIYRGDFANLMHFHDDGAIYVEALQRYASILTDSEIVSALRSFNALLVDEGADGDWRIRVRDKLGHYDADVLMAMHDAVDDAVLGHRRYLRAELAELAADRRAAR